MALLLDRISKPPVVALASRPRRKTSGARRPEAAEGL